MGASAEENRTVWINAKAPQDFERKVGIQANAGGIVLDAADLMDAFARNTERYPAFHVFRFLNADRVETAKGRRDKGTETLETRFGSLREAGVHEDERD